MTLEQQVCSLEPSKELRELGYKQGSLFYWTNTDREEPSLYVRTGIDDTTFGYSTLKAESVDGRPYWFPVEELDTEDWYAAPTVAELGENLPSMFEYKGHICCVVKSFKIDDEFATTINTIDSDNHLVWVNAKTEADARAKMLIYLLKNKLITL